MMREETTNLMTAKNKIADGRNSAIVAAMPKELFDKPPYTLMYHTIFVTVRSVCSRFRNCFDGHFEILRIVVNHKVPRSALRDPCGAEDYFRTQNEPIAFALRHATSMTCNRRVITKVVHILLQAGARITDEVMELAYFYFPETVPLDTLELLINHGGTFEALDFVSSRTCCHLFDPQNQALLALLVRVGATRLRIGLYDPTVTVYNMMMDDPTSLRLPAPTTTATASGGGSSGSDEEEDHVNANDLNSDNSPANAFSTILHHALFHHFVNSSRKRSNWPDNFSWTVTFRMLLDLCKYEFGAIYQRKDLFGRTPLQLAKLYYQHEEEYSGGEENEDENLLFRKESLEIMEMMKATAREREIAVFSALHPRLGKGSGLAVLSKDLLQLVAAMSFPAAWPSYGLAMA